ncbi:MAG: TIGR01777 family oxidoreductase [Chloroflexota bacterium]
MRVLITGGTGTIGRRLGEHLGQYAHTALVVSRQPYRPATLPARIAFARWDGQTAAGWGQLVEQADAIVNLAGAGIAAARWTNKRKKLIQDSRVKAGQAVVEAMRAAANRPKVLIQASAVGYYGPHRAEVITEASGPGQDFLAEVCRAWEASTEAVEALGVRRVIIRTGVVLDRRGGALPKLLLPFRLFAGGPAGSGRQWISWIHYADEVSAIRFLLENEQTHGPFNLTAPDPLTNGQFAKAIGQAMQRPAFTPAPGFALKLMLGEMATVLLEGQRVAPQRLQELGFQFEFPTAGAALADLLAVERPRPPSG